MTLITFIGILTLTLGLYNFYNCINFPYDYFLQELSCGMVLIGIMIILGGLL